MKTHSFVPAPWEALVLLLALTLATPIGLAADGNPPELLSYQGYLVDANGVPLGDPNPANHTVFFKIYDKATGGQILWGEEQTVTVDRGYFSVLLGQGSVISGVDHGDLSGLFNSDTAADRYIGITLGAETDPEIAPRIRLVTSPYAYLSRYAQGLTDGEGSSVINLEDQHGLKVSQDLIVRQPGQNHAIRMSPSQNGIGVNPELVIQPAAGIAGNDADFHISLNAIGSPGSFDQNYIDSTQEASQIRFHKDGNLSFRTAPANGSNPIAWNTRLYIKHSDGRVGIGTTIPSAALEVNGTIKATTFDGSFTIPDGDVTTAKLASGAVTSAKVANGTIAPEDLAQGIGVFQRAGAQFALPTGINRVGIGKAAPGAVLHVKQVDANTVPLFVDDANDNRILHIDKGGRIGVGSTHANYKLNVRGETGRDPFQVQNAAGSPLVQILDSGNVGIGSTPTAMLHLRKFNSGSQPLLVQDLQGNMILELTDEGRFGYRQSWNNTSFTIRAKNTDEIVFLVEKSDGGNGLEYKADGTFKVNGTSVHSSDRRLKKDIASLPDALDRVLRLRPSEYRWKTDPAGAPKRIGFVAQDVAEVFPDLVDASGDTLALDYNAFGVLAIKAIQEQQERMAEKDAQIAALEARLTDLTASVENRESRLDRLERHLERLVGGLGANASGQEIASR